MILLVRCSAAVFAAGFLRVIADFQGSTHLVDIDNGAIRYGKETSHGPVAALVSRIESGNQRLSWDDRLGWLPAVSKALGVSMTSQMLVFSKTSLQREHIHPRNPRALYYNDDVYLGYIPGAPLMEISEVDPHLGGVFYTLEQRKSDRPVFTRTDNCLECHASGRTMGVPGHLVRSFETGADGMIDLPTAAESIDHRTALAERWGGWYVTGTHGKMEHRGNRIGPDFARARKDPTVGGNMASLDGLFETAKYAAPGSDIVALMVFEHQTHMHNYIARLNYMATQHLAAYGHADYLKSPVEGFVKYLLFAEEFELTSPVSGDPAFVKEFEAAGPRDRKGRSLRQLDLKRRMFRFPCSFLIHSKAFHELPAALKRKIYARLDAVLAGNDASGAFARLSAEDRTAVREILADTLDDLPEDWLRNAGPTK
jgi:hypothetical protein